MAVRNFWMMADIDGYRTVPRGGPRNKNGGMTVTVYQRSGGKIEEGVRVSCMELDGKLQSTVYINGERVGRYVTDR